jgi:hypothetical protein
MHRCLCLALLTALLAATAIAQTPSQKGGAVDPENDPSGMYSFLKEGEYLQLTFNGGELSGFISRFGDSDSDKGQFIDQFFTKGSLNGDHLSFATKIVHGIWYEFDGTIQRQPGKQTNQEGYRVLKGTLKQHSTDAKGADKARERSVEFKSFPEGVSR